MSKKLDELNNWYQRQLKDLGLVTSEDGKVTYVDEFDTSTPVTVANERLTVPLKEVLKLSNLDGVAVYHPLSEQFSTALSPVLNALKGYMQLNLTMKYMSAIIGISELLADTSRHKKLSSKVGKFIKEFGNLDEKSASAISKLLGKIGNAPEKRLINVLVRPSEQGEDGLRTTVITSPVLTIMKEALENGEVDVHDVKFRRKDYEEVVKLFSSVMGFDDDVDRITKSSSDRTAPYYESLLNAYLEIAKQWNSIYSLFHAYVPVIKDAGSYELDWEDELEDFAKFAASHVNLVPVTPHGRPEKSDAASQRKNAVLSGSGIEKDTAPWDEEPPKRTLESDNDSGAPKVRSLDDYSSYRDRERPRRDDRGYDRDYDRFERSRFGRDRGFGDFDADFADSGRGRRESILRERNSGPIRRRSMDDYGHSSYSAARSEFSRPVRGGRNRW